jgi:O-acetyl-ADP-ribose deacetylase (regulator of RNase III)
LPLSAVPSACRTGDAKITRGYRLPARHVIHTVGPVWNGGKHKEPELLASCYRTTLALAHAHQLKTVAFPAISCGVYGYPLEQAATIAVRETSGFLDAHPEFEKIIFACFDRQCSITGGVAHANLKSVKA